MYIHTPIGERYTVYIYMYMYMYHMAFSVKHVFTVLELGLSPLAREMCKRGCPVTGRRELWSLAVGLDPTQEQVRDSSTG